MCGDRSHCVLRLDKDDVFSSRHSRGRGGKASGLVMDVNAQDVLRVTGLLQKERRAHERTRKGALLVCSCALESLVFADSETRVKEAIRDRDRMEFELKQTVAQLRKLERDYAAQKRELEVHKKCGANQCLASEWATGD